MCCTKPPIALLPSPTAAPSPHSPPLCSLWVLGAAGCALSPSFLILLLCRLAVGAACGPFIALAAPLIDDGAPPQQKSLWLASLFLCIPVGFALGYFFGGVVSPGGFGWWGRAGRGVQHACTGRQSNGEAGTGPQHLRNGQHWTAVDGRLVRVCIVGWSACRWAPRMAGGQRLLWKPQPCCPWQPSPCWRRRWSCAAARQRQRWEQVCRRAGGRAGARAGD